MPSLGQMATSKRRSLVVAAVYVWLGSCTVAGGALAAAGLRKLTHRTKEAS